MGKSGTGLGMSVVWGTVQDHNGYINVESTEGKGTIFELYFPVTREGIIQVKQSIAIDEYMGHQESILVVDDVKEQRLSLVLQFHRDQLCYNQSKPHLYSCHGATTRLCTQLNLEHM